MRKPNYRFDRAERARSKEIKKAEKLKAQAARREANDSSSSPSAEEDAAVSTEPNEEHDGS
jgi:hypothetical protein